MNDNETADRVTNLMLAYADELADEAPVLWRMSEHLWRDDMTPSERETTEVIRRRLLRPSDSEDVDMVIDFLERLADKPSTFDVLRGTLRLAGQAAIADELGERRKRRDTDIKRLIDIVKQFRGRDGQDYRKWEGASKRFDDAVIDDADFIRAILSDRSARASAPSGTPQENPTQRPRRPRHIYPEEVKRAILAFAEGHGNAPSRWLVETFKKWRKTLPNGPILRGAKRIYCGEKNERGIGKTPFAEIRWVYDTAKHGTNGKRPPKSRQREN